MKPKNSVRLDRTIGRFVYRLHLALYRLTGGAIGARTAQGPILLLTYTGRRTGKRRIPPLLFMPDEDRFVVVAANGGRPEHPAWYLNVRDRPEVEVQSRRQKVMARAHVASAEERAQLWPRLTQQYAGWAHYQTLTDREIPVVVLAPA